MPDIKKNGSVFLGGPADAGEFRGWRPSDIPNDLILLTKSVDVALGAVPRTIDGLAYIRDVARGRK
ncbi:MAG: hypothetical protein JWQ83_1143 [Lacunisphaera sp.]|nr:hypothetical protein [Lacunisphaera sp.]